MYGKLFTSIYDGTLYGHWQAIVTMQTLIALSSPDGIVDMTPQAIAARTSIPLEIISKGLEILARPDPYTRTPGEDGKRIALIDEHRPWGWRLVNHAKYKALRNMEQKREADRQRIYEKRKKNKDVAIASQHVANVAHTDTDTDTDTKKKDTVGLSPNVLRLEAGVVLSFLNEKTGKRFESQTNIDFILARLREGATVDDCRAVIAMKCREWLTDEKMCKFLRPATLFNKTNFAQYKGELGAAT